MPDPSHPLPRLLVAAGLAFSLLLCTVPYSATAQNRVTSGANGNSSMLPQIQQQLDLALANATTVIALEGALDAESYVVGPGDQFVITVSGVPPIQVLSPVGADGALALLDVGRLEAAGRTLENVQAEAYKLLQQQYQRVAVQVNLVQPRSFYVHVSGAVPEPGRYLMLPVARVDDAIQQAFASNAFARPDPEEEGVLRIPGSATSEVPSLDKGYRPSLRNVMLRRRDGSTQSLDLFRYYARGDMSQNPYLRDGDVVHLPPYHHDRDAVRVSGQVASPGNFEFRPNDTVLSILELATGGIELSRLGTVRLTRRPTDALAEPRVLDVQAMLAGKAEPVVVEAGDHLNVLSQDTDQASIYGFVEYPGTYPIVSAQTTLRELLALAGGLKPDANVRGAYLERRSSMAFKADGQASDLDFFGRTYLRSSMGKNRVAVDIEQALAPDAEPVILYSGDVVVFPRDEQTVFVTGNVVKPGYVPFSPDKTVHYYVEQAGGTAPLTIGVYIFQAGSGDVSTNLDTIVRPGDTIFVNRESIAETPELQSLLITDEVSKRQTKIATTQTIITGITALVSVVNTFLLIRDRLNN